MTPKLTCRIVLLIMNSGNQGKTLPAGSEPPSDLRLGPIADRNRPSYCYASVIRPLEGLSIKGAVFHQSFNNCFDGDQRQ